MTTDREVERAGIWEVGMFDPFISPILSRRAHRRAAKAQADACEASADFQRVAYGQAKARLTRYRAIDLE